MPPVYLSKNDQAMRQMAQPANGFRALVSQQQNDFATPSAQIAMRTGVLFQYPQSGANYTSGYGQEVLSAGSGSAPVLRLGVLTWVSPSGGTQTVTGLCFFDASGNLRTVWGPTGVLSYDTSGNPMGGGMTATGSCSINFPGSTNGSVSGVAHGLGRTPKAVGVFPIPTGSGSYCIAANAVNMGTSTFDVQARTVDAAAIGPGNVTANWVAIG